jgi:hypothetical protein
MFTWICPKCGREVPPAYNDCPDCAQKTAPADAQQPEAPAVASAPPPVQSAPPQAPPPQRPPYAAPVQPRAYEPPPPPPPARPGLPTWVMTILFAFAFFGLVAGVYWLVGAARGTNAKPSAAVESPAAKPNAKTSPYQKYIEISGVRFLTDAKKKTEARFVITNHSNADLIGLGGNVTVWGRTRNSEEDAAGTFAFTTDLKAYESKELVEPLNTKLKIYELPDWQNVSTDVQITAPASGSPQ